MNFLINFTAVFLKRKKWLVLAAIIGILAIIGAGVFAVNSEKKGLVEEGLVGTHEERDLPDQVLNLISKPLIKVDKSGTPSAELAESWEVNNEANIYKVKLKDNLKWSDGKDIVASEIYLSIPDVQISALDDKTLEFRLAETFTPFPTLLTKPILRKAETPFGFELVGVGPYKVTSYKKDGPFVKTLDLASDDENLPSINLTFYPNEKIAKTALKLGEVEALLGVLGTEDLDKNHNLKTFTNYNQLVTIFLNTEDPILSDENLRLALAYGAPEIKDQEAALTPLSPQSWGYNGAVKDFLNNRQKAEEALDKVEKGKEDQITLTATSSLEGVGQDVAKAWKELGLNATLQVESGIPQNFQALLITQNIPSDPDQYSLWHSTQKGSTNISRLASPRIDKDLEDGRKTADMEVRKQKYHDFQRILLDEAPAIFLYFPKYNVVYMNKAESELNKVLSLQLPNLQ